MMENVRQRPVMHIVLRIGGELKAGCLSSQKKVVVAQSSGPPKGVLIRAKFSI